MKATRKALLAHYFTNMTVLTILVVSGIVMLFLVFREIRTRDEWKQNRVAFFSIWGLSCLFGTTWGLALINIEPLSDFIHFLFCILNSFQGMCLWCAAAPDSTLGLKYVSTCVKYFRFFPPFFLKRFYNRTETPFCVCYLI